MKRKLTYELYRKTKTKAVNISLAFTMAASTLTGAAPLFLSQKAFADSSTVVTASNLHDWHNYSYGTTGKLSFVADSGSPLGTGALQFDTPAGDAVSQLDRDLAPTPVDSVHDLGYSVKRLAGEPFASPAYVLGIDTNGDSSADFYAWFEPVYNNGSNYDQWQHYTIDISNSKFWTGHAVGPLAGGNGQNLFTLDDVAQDFPGAKVVELTINQGSGNPGWSTRVDDVMFNGTAYNFESAPILGAENFNTVSDSSYKGISVGFNAKDFSGVSAVTVALKRADGTTATLHGTQDLFDLIDANTAPYQFTAPFIIQSGSYKGDSYWTSDQASWNTGTVPTSVTITVTGANGTQSVTNSTFTAGAPSWPEYSSLVPPEAPADAHFLTDKSNTLACGSTVNTIFGNKLQFVWAAGSSNSASYRTLITYPDGGTKWAYTGSRNVWMGNVAAYGYDNGFGEHGDGVYAYAVQAQNSNQMWSANTTCTLAYDTHIPVAHLVTAPADGAHVNGKLTIEANGADNVALKGLFVDIRSKDGSTWKAGCTGTPVFTDSKNATLGCTVDTSKLVDDTTYMLRAHASDFAGYGNVNADAVRYFTIDRTLPTASITSPTGVIKGQTITIKGSATDNADFNYYYCYVTLPGSREVGTRGADCNTTWHSVTDGVLGTVNLTGQADGNYEAHLVAYDKAGNRSDINYAVPFTLDNTPPVVAITSPSNSTLSYVHDGTVKILGTVTDTHPDHYYLHITGPNGYNAGPSTVKNTASFTDKELYDWNLNGLSSGEYVIDLEARDTVGNKDDRSVQKLHVTVDNTGPDSTNDLPSLVNGTVVVHQTVTDNGTPASGKLRIWKLDSTNKPDNTKFHASALTAVDQDGMATYTLDTTKDLYGDGNYIAKFTSMDAAGNGTVQQAYFTVDNTGPSTPAATPEAGKYVGPKLVSLSSDDGTGSGLDAIYYTTDGSTPDQTSFKYTGAFLVDSSRTVQAIAYDKLGNASNVLTAAYTIVPPTPPAPLTPPAGGQGGQVDFTPAAAVANPAAAFGLTRARALQGDETQTHDTDTPSSAVLGASTTNPDATPANGHVKGASTVDTQTAADKKSANFLVLGWWWLLVLTAIIALVYLMAGRSSNKDAS